MPLPKYNFDEPVGKYARRDVTVLEQGMTVGEALEQIRREGIGEKIIYFYVVDEARRLVGVLATRRLLTAQLSDKLREIMVRRVAAIPENATLLDACEQFVMMRLLAYPVVDAEKRVVGVVDVSLFTDQVFKLTEHKGAEGEPDDIFEAIGFHLAQARNRSLLKVYQARFPWLLATLASGMLCAVLAGCYEATLHKFIILGLFLALVRARGESVSVQSMTVTIHALRRQQPSWRWFWGALRREAASALLLGLSCSVIVGLVVWAWKQEPLPALALALSIAASQVAACVFGLSIPALMHALKWDPKIASGPVTLAVADVATVLIYFVTAGLLLR